jgi:hypothetical protein
MAGNPLGGASFGLDIDQALHSIRSRNYVYNPSTLAWEAATGSSFGGADINLLGEYSTRWLEDSGDTTIIYVGEAVFGAAENTSVWRVQRVNTTTGKVEWAGTGAFDKRWDQRESLSYS